MFEVNVYVCVYFDLRAAEGPGGRGGGAKVGAGWSPGRIEKQYKDISTGGC